MKIAVVTDCNIEFQSEKIDRISSEFRLTPEKRLEYTAVIFLKPFSEAALKHWMGHPHLRCFEDIDKVYRELEQLENSIEYEKKYLINYPDLDALKKYYLYKSDIEQIYLKSDVATHRIRKRTFNGVTVCYETLKISISSDSSHEYESVISEDKYNELKALADPAKRPIIKSRYCFLYKEQYFELDVYTFWNDKAVLEIELQSEEDKVILPPEIDVIKDVSEDFKYKNSQLARIDYDNY